MARLQQDMVQGCNEEAGEVTGWPIDQIQAAVAPDQRQSQMRDDLGNAIVKASDQIRSHCQSNVAFTPTGRLSQMHDRLGALVDAVNTVNPPLSAFYDSLSDEQKARFDHIAPRAPRHGQAAQGDLTTATIRGQCNAGMMAWPTDQIDRVVRPDEAQRAKLQALQSAAAQAAETIKAACPADVPRRHRRGWRRSASAWRPCCKASRQCSRRLPISTIRSATIRRRASTPWAGNCSRKADNSIRHYGEPRFPDAVQREALHRRSGIVSNSACVIVPVQQRTISRRAALGTKIQSNSAGNFALSLARRSALTSTTCGNVPLSFMS